MSEEQHTPLLTGLRSLVEDREWELEVVPLVVGQRSVREKDWLETFKLFGIGKEEGRKIIHKLLLRPEINSGEAAYTHLGGSERPDRGAEMGGGSFTSSRRTVFGQGKTVARGHEDVWDKRRGWKKNHLQARSHSSLLLSEHEKLFGSYWRQVFGPPGSLMHLLGKGLSVRASNSLLHRRGGFVDAKGGCGKRKK